MRRFHFERGRKFECSLEVLQFIGSDWEAMDRITGRDFKAKKCGKNCFTIKQPSFEAKLDLVHADYKPKGSFKYSTTLVGKGIHASGILEINYGEVNKKLIYAEAILDMEIAGLFGSIISRIHQGTLQNYADMLADYLHLACIKLGHQPEQCLNLLSEDQQREFRQLQEQRRREEIFESTLEITPLGRKFKLELETPIPTYKKIEEIVSDGTQLTTFLKRFNELVDKGSFYFTLSRLPAKDKEITELGEEFYSGIKDLGFELYSKYVSGQLRVWMKSMFDYPKAKIKLKIEAFGASNMYPWELMHDGDDFLCLKSATVRIEAGIRRYKEILDVNGVLVVASNPLGDLENVEREANSVLNSIKRIGNVESKLLSGSDASKENVIKEIESGRYQVLHYSGHSNFDKKFPGNSYLLLKDGRKLIADELARLSKDKELHLVFLNSCLSGADKVDVFNVTGLSSAFVKSGVPNVIGMKWSVSDYGATLLSKKFYEEYVTTKDPTEALRKARISVGEATDWNDPAWAAPIIYVA